MADENKIQAEAAAQAPAKVAEAIAATAEKVVDESAKTAKRTRAATARRAKRAAKPSTARKTRSTKAARRTTRTTRTAARKTAAALNEGIQTMNKTKTAFPGFEAFSNLTPFQTIFADAGERGQEFAKRSQKAAEEIADLTRANVEAIVEAGRVAVEGARSIGQDVVARGRDGVEQTAGAIRSLAEAKSPTEFVQLQSELARTSFDRMVAETSKLTESMVKLAGEAFQPLSNRATANTERFNSLVA